MYRHGHIEPQIKENVGLDVPVTIVNLTSDDRHAADFLHDNIIGLKRQR